VTCLIERTIRDRLLTTRIRASSLADVVMVLATQPDSPVEAPFDHLSKTALPLTRQTGLFFAIMRLALIPAWPRSK
jgi:hypothetical protein